MNRWVKISQLFNFFCLNSCQEIRDFRDIEISFSNVDYAIVYINTLPDSNQYYRTLFDREYQQTMNISGVDNGRYLIRCTAEKNKHLVTVDSVINYTGRFAWGVEF